LAPTLVLPLFIEGLTEFGLTVSMKCTTSLLLLKPFEMNTHLGSILKKEIIKQYLKEKIVAIY
jgi:hypothetical protein